MRILIQTLAVLGILCAAAPAHASSFPTPDGVTPSIETICDDQPNNRKGLCNAFCEAMDCELCVVLPDDTLDCSAHPGINANACENVRDNWRNKVGDSSALLPCQDDEGICPCAELSGWLVFPDAPVCESNSFDQVVIASYLNEDPNKPSALSGVVGEEGFHACAVFNGQNFIELEITENDELVCRDDLLQFIQQNNLSCPVAEL